MVIWCITINFIFGCIIPFVTGTESKVCREKLKTEVNLESYCYLVYIIIFISKLVNDDKLYN